MNRLSFATPVLAAVALAACNSIECGIGTHEKGGLCVADDQATVFSPTTNTITNTVFDTTPVTNTVIQTVPNTIVQTVPVTNTVPVTVTVPVDTDPVLAPGQFEAPLLQLKKLLDTKGAVGAAGSGQSHMHISEVRYRPGDGAARPAEMAYCSYTFGVVNTTDPENASYMAQGWTWPATDPNTGDTFKTRAPGCQHLAYDDDDPDFVYVAQHGDIDDGPGFLSAIDLHHTLASGATVDTLAPVLGPQLMESSVAYEGLDYENGHLFVALHDGGLGVYHREPLGPDGLPGPQLQPSGSTVNDDNSMVADAVYTTDLTNVWDVMVRGTLAYVCNGLDGLVVLDVTDPLNPVELGRVATGGNIRDIDLNDPGTIAYLATETNGMVTVDVTDPSNPTVLGTVKAPSAIEAVAESNGYVAVAAWDDTRVYDVADASNPTIVAATRLAVPKVYTGDDGSRPDITGRTLAVDLAGDVLFNGDWWTPYTYRFKPENGVAPYVFLPEDVNLLSFPGDLDVGQSSNATIEVYNDGNADLTLYNNWVDNPDFTVTPWQVLIPAGQSATLTLKFTPSIAPTVDTADTAAKPTSVEEHGFLHIQSDDPTQPDRVAYLVGNMAALSVGDPFPSDMAGELVDGTDWTYEANGRGNVLLFAYFATY